MQSSGNLLVYSDFLGKVAQRCTGLRSVLDKFVQARWLNRLETLQHRMTKRQSHPMLVRNRMEMPQTHAPQIIFRRPIRQHKTTPPLRHTETRQIRMPGRQHRMPRADNRTITRRHHPEALQNHPPLRPNKTPVCRDKTMPNQQHPEIIQHHPEINHDRTEMEWEPTVMDGRHPEADIYRIKTVYFRTVMPQRHTPCW